MKRYVCIHQHYPGKIATLSDISKELRTQQSSPTFSRTVYYVTDWDKPPYGTGIYEVLPNGALKLVAENFDSSD